MVKEKIIKSGNKKLIYSKRIVTVSNEPLSISTVFDNDFNVEIVFLFNYSDEKKPSYSINKVETSSDSSLKYEIELFNFNSSVGIGLINPIELMFHKVNNAKKAIYLTFFVYKHNGAFPIIDLALYEEI